MSHVTRRKGLSSQGRFFVIFFPVNRIDRCDNHQCRLFLYPNGIVLEILLDRVATIHVSVFIHVVDDVFYLIETNARGECTRIGEPLHEISRTRRGVPQVVVVVVSRRGLGLVSKGRPKWHSSHGHSLEPAQDQWGQRVGKSIPVSSRSIRSILRHDASALGCCGHRLVDIP